MRKTELFGCTTQFFILKFIPWQRDPREDKRQFLYFSTGPAFFPAHKSIQHRRRHNVRRQTCVLDGYIASPFFVCEYTWRQPDIWPSSYAQHKCQARSTTPLNLRKALRIVIPESPFYPENSDSQRRQTMTLQRVHPASNGVKDRHRSEAHVTLCGRKSVDRVWNFAFEELGRININFDPAWMSGKKQNSQNSRIWVAPCLPS
jgi:hypothetical protein